ncbi:MAG: oligoendopeptidase F [Firmicutes bacterium]|nr:oligoendopeptidase F [Bacillota bacterium]
MISETADRLQGRDQIPAQFKWRLEDIYASAQDWERDAARLQDVISHISRWEGHLGESGDSLLACLQENDTLGLLAERLFAYARMRRDEDNGDTAAQALADRATSLLVRAQSATAFIVPEILSVPAATIRGFIAQKAELKVYEHFLENILRMRPHTLSTAEERIVAESGEVLGAPQNIFTLLNNADLRFPSVRDEHGQMVEITHGRFIRLMESPDRRVRRETFQGLYQTYEKQRNTLAALLTSSIKKDIFLARVHRYPSALAAALDQDNVPVPVYDSLLEAVHESLPLVYRYVELRRRMLDLDQVHMYDLYVPLVRGADKTFTYEEAVEAVQNAVRPLGPEYGRVFESAFRSGWIDVFENRGKTSGAYSWGTYGVHPFVLMNFQGNLDSVFTLAHEMGHSMHSYFSDTNQAFVNSHYSIFVAEVASTVNELLLTAHLLRELTDRQQRMWVLNYHLEQFRTTVFRQTMFAEFEKITHERAEAGEALTADDLCRIYAGLNRTYYGPDAVIDPEIAMEWARIPHFYTAFYVYQYATGFSAATALYQQILEEGQPAVERYLRFLRSGGSDYPINLLRQAGVDMASPDTVRRALQVFGSLLDQMEELAR